MKVPVHMIEKMEENLKLFEEAEELQTKIRPEYSIDLGGNHQEKLEKTLWFALCAHEEELKKSIERKKQILADKDVG